MVRRACAVWLLLLVVAVFNGAARQALIVPRLGSEGAHVASTLIGVTIFVAIIFLTVRWIDPALRAPALARVGVGWTLATVAFEFAFGRFVAHRAWAELLEDYNVLAGRLWVLVLITLLVTPPLAGRFRRVR